MSHFLPLSFFVIKYLASDIFPFIFQEFVNTVSLLIGTDQIPAYYCIKIAVNNRNDFMRRGSEL